MPRNTRNYPLFLPLYIIYNNVYTPESPLWMGHESIICDDLIKKCGYFFVVCVKSSTFALAKRKQKRFLKAKCVLSSVGRAIDS